LLSEWILHFIKHTFQINFHQIPHTNCTEVGAEDMTDSEIFVCMQRTPEQT